MLNRTANVFTFLILALLLTFGWTMTAAIHDFNNDAGAIFIHEMRFVEQFRSRSDVTVTYSVEYTKCGPGIDQIPAQDFTFTLGKFNWTAPQYMRVETDAKGYGTHDPISLEEAERRGFTQRQDFVSYNGDILNFGQRLPICQIKWSGVWATTQKMFKS